MIDFILERYNYWIFIILMMTGLYIVISRGNLVKKIIGLNLFQTSVFIFYISIGKIIGGTAPILVGDYGGDHSGDHGSDHADTGHSDTGHTDAGHGDHGAEASVAEAVHGVETAAADSAHGAHGAAEIIYTNPLPHVLILTAIVVGVATTAVGLALAVRIREAYGTIEEDELEADDAIAEFGADAALQSGRSGAGQ